MVLVNVGIDNYIWLFEVNIRMMLIVIMLLINNGIFYLKSGEMVMVKLGIFVSVVNL